MKRIQQFREMDFLKMVSGIFICVIWMILICLPMGCDDGGSGKMPLESSEVKTGGTGSALFRIRWRHAPPVSSGPEKNVSVQAIDDCEAQGVATVSCHVYDGSDAFLVSGGPWPCPQRRGSVSWITSGSNRRFVVFGEDAAGDIIYHGMNSDIIIVPGETTDVGFIDALPFVPVASAPANGAEVTLGEFSFDWTLVDNAHEYRILVADNENFETPVIDETTAEPPFAPQGLSTASSFYWRVYAQDAHGNQGAGSAVRRFTTNSGPEPGSDSFPGIQVFSGTNELNVLENDSDPDPGDTLTIIAVESPSAAGGSVRINESGDRLLYDAPVTGYVGEDTFTYTVADGQGNTATAGVTVVIVAGIARLSVNNQGQQSTVGSRYTSISEDGRFVAFHSESSDLVSNDSNGVSDVFIYDRQARQIERVSVSSSGDEANADSFNPALSADGLIVAFVSSATNLVPNDGNERWDVFVRDRDNGSTERVSISSGGGEADGDSYDPRLNSNGPAISADGRFVVFISSATNLVPGDTNVEWDVFVRDRLNGETQRVNICSSGDEAEGGGSFDPAISADGRFVAYVSDATNLVPGDTNGRRDVFLHALRWWGGSGETERVSVSSAGGQADSYSSDPAISADGRLVAFLSRANNLVSDDNNDIGDIFIRDRQVDPDTGMGSTERVSVSSSGVEANGKSYEPSISADGRFVAFASFASNLVGGDTDDVGDYFIHDRLNGGRTIMVGDAGGYYSEEDLLGPKISLNGRFMAFDSYATDLVPGDTNGAWDVFAAPNPLFP